MTFQRVGKRGQMLGIEVDGVLGRLTAKQTDLEDFDLRTELQGFIHAGAVMGAAIKSRMRDRRTYADGSQWRPSTSRGVMISRKYAKLAGVLDHATAKSRTLIRDNKGRVRYRKPAQSGYRNLASLYAATGNRGAFDLSGGLWRGFVARTWGRVGVRLFFDGTSQGRGRWLKVGTNLRGDPVWEKASKSVRNWEKAGAIYLGIKRNPIEFSRAEQLGIASAVANRSIIGLAKAMDKVPSIAIQFKGDKRLAAILADILAR